MKFIFPKSKSFGKRGKYAVCSEIKFIRGLDAGGEDSLVILVLADYRGNKVCEFQRLFFLF